MRSILVGLFLVVGAFSAPAEVLYSFSQPASPPGIYPTPAIVFNFTVPALLTGPTLIPGSSINSLGVHYMGLDLSVLSVDIDPGLNGAAPSLGIRMGWGSQEVMSEGMCFVPDHYACTASPAAQILDHFGVYTIGGTYLTISPSDAPQTATPEPRFEAVAGLLALLMVAEMAHRAHCTVTDQSKC